MTKKKIIVTPCIVITWLKASGPSTVFSGVISWVRISSASTPPAIRKTIAVKK